MDRKWWTLIAVSMATFMLLIDLTIIIVVIPDIHTTLGISFDGLRWVIDAYALTLSAFLLSAGSLADRYGRKRLFLTGLSVFTLGSVLCADAPSSAMLVASRAAQGVGGAILFATAISLIAADFHGRERGIAFGVWGSITGIAAALGPIAGGLIVLTWFGWRGVFWVNLPIDIAAIVLTVPESKAPWQTRLDWAGFLTLIGALTSLVYGIIRAGEKSWSDDVVVVSLLLGVAMLVAFVVVEKRVEHPMFDLSLFRIPTFVGASFAAFAMNGSLFALTLYLALYLQNALGYSALTAGLQMFVNSAVAMVFAIVAGRLSARGIPTRWTIGGGLLLVGIGLLSMCGLTAESDWTHLLPGLVISGIGAGLVNPGLAETAVGVVHFQKSGMAGGSSTTFRQIGIAAGVAVYGTIFAATLTHQVEATLVDQPALRS